MTRYFLIIITASSCCLTCLCKISQPSVQQPLATQESLAAQQALATQQSLATQLSPSDQPTLSTPQSPAQIEARVLQLLGAGKQSEAEEYLDTQAPQHKNNQRVVFLLACCVRSRFMIRESAPIFAAVADMGTNSVTGQCALQMLYLDVRKDIDQHFNALRSLVESNPDDMMLRWMIAVQCRSFDKNEEGVKHYRRLLERWSPGPVLVHQTYGNLLEELEKYDEALVERRKAVELEPAGWSYQGLGSTLSSLKRFKEAGEAYAKSVELAPDNSSYWASWGWGLMQERRFPEAIAKCEKAISLNPKGYSAYSYWGRCLELQGEKQEAIAKYKKAIELNHNYKYARERITALEKEVEAKPASASGGNTGK